ncbi:hypothetical protein M9Y10_031808 [Tritrichomonas musculus]|uniref:mitogen-activated protein kinase kinase n=1 Tax=Tritrichomonas musculus TaxID=1915356 RepID=A0ABR2GZT4_9EUKA
MIHKNALDYAKENNHLEIVELLTKIPIKTMQSRKDPRGNNKHHLMQEINSSETGNGQLEIEIIQLKNKFDKLENEMSKFKDSIAFANQVRQIFKVFGKDNEILDNLMKLKSLTHELISDDDLFRNKILSEPVRIIHDSASDDETAQNNDILKYLKDFLKAEKITDIPNLLKELKSEYSVARNKNENLLQEIEDCQPDVELANDIRKMIPNCIDKNIPSKDKAKKDKLLLEELQKKLSSIENMTNQAGAFKILDESEMKSLERIEEIGYGGGGKVIKVAKKEVYALKEMNIKNTSTKIFQNFIQEYEIMGMMDHQNILKAKGFFMSSKKIPPCILLEYCPLNLQKAIEDKIFSNEELAKIIYQITEGMKYIHFKKVIHRDLKPTNILITSDGTVKICDFGISKLMTLEAQSMTQGIGSQKFMAPEIINEEDHYDEKVDVYSFGVVVFFILSGGQLPKIRIGDLLKGMKASIPSYFTDFSKKLVSDCWNFEAKDRPSFASIVDDLAANHYNLLPLNGSETTNVENFVKQHKAKLPNY